MDDDNVIIAWNEGAYTSRLRDATGEMVSVVTSRDALEGEIRAGSGQEWTDARLIVLLELIWERQRSQFYGFELVKDLLLDDFNQPVLLCSFLERERFYTAEGIGRFLAPMPFSFIRLPTTPEALVGKAQDAEAFSPRLRAYVRENYLAQEPFGRVAHDLRNALDKDAPEAKRMVQRCLEDLDALNVTLPTELAEQRSVVQRTLQQGAEISDEVATAVSELGNRLEQHSATRRTAGSENGEASAPSNYAVMLVEDDDADREEIRRGLKPHFEVFAASSAEEALEGLRMSRQKYLAIVADWLLLEEDGITWQPMQGFDLLVKAWEESAPICLIALTSLEREAVASVLRSTSLEIDWFPKSEVGENTRWPYHAFAGYIRKRVRALLPDLVNMPEKAWWSEKGLGDLFLELKYESGRWEDVRQDAEETARQIVEEYYEEETATSPINKGDYRLTAPGDKTTPNMGHLEKILPQRLAVLALHFEYEQSLVDIRTLLRMEEELDESTIKNRAKSWFAKLGLEREYGRIPESSVMEHEREWLNQTYGLDLKRAELEAQAKSGGTEHQSLSSEFNSFLKEVEGIEYRLNRYADRYAEDPPSVGAIDTMEEAINALKVFTRWGKGKQSNRKDFLRDLMEQILDVSENQQVLREFDRIEEVQDLIDSLRE